MNYLEKAKVAKLDCFYADNIAKKLDISYVSVCRRKNISQELQIFCESKKQKFEEGKNV